MTSLIQRLEKATRPDVTLDMAISRAVRKGPVRTDIQGFPMDVKDYTASIDAALTLVPDHLAIHEMGHTHPDKRGWYVCILMKDRDCSGHHATPAIALCIAALKSIAAKTPGEAEPP